jgi:dihydrofolate reductase
MPSFTHDYEPPEKARGGPRVSMKPRLTLIAAVARNGVIGRDNQLPWRLPEDLMRFKAVTAGNGVVMGRKTWESLPESFRPLPGRRNIVVSRNPDYVAEGATVVDSVAAALGIAADTNEVFVIGGAELYAQALPLADCLQLTEIDADFEGDARFPDFDRRQWRETGRTCDRAEVGFAYAFVTYERK